MLRKAGPSDAGKIIALEKSYYDGYSIGKEVLLAWIRTGRYWVIEEGKIVVGSMYFEFVDKIKQLPWEHEPVDGVPNYVYISEVAVKSEEGLPALFSKVMEAARKRGAKAVLWLTGEKANHDRIEQRFLKKSGFKLDQRVERWECSPGYFIGDHNIWIKRL